jgi:hypothetical protein
MAPFTMEALTITQRNLYLYFLNHFKKNKPGRCFVPHVPSRKDRETYQIKAVQVLAQKGLIRLDQTASHYTRWTMEPPEA